MGTGASRNVQGSLAASRLGRQSDPGARSIFGRNNRRRPESEQTARRLTPSHEVQFNGLGETLMNERDVRARARAISSAHGVLEALAAGTLPSRADVTLSEGVVLGLLKQGVRKYFGILGHG